MTGRGNKKESGRTDARDRDTRRAEALRENLKRRKAQARLRAEAGGEDDSGAGEKDTGSRSA